MAKSDCISWIAANFSCISWIVANFGCIFWPFAIFASGWFGLYAIKIWPEPQPWKLGTAKNETVKRQWNAKTVYLIWFNFTGSIVGWLALWVLLGRHWAYILGGFPVDPSWWDVLGGFIAFVGITGHLPWTVNGIISSFALIVSKAANRLGS